MNGHRATSNGHGVHRPSRLPTFVRLALLVRPWWRGVTLNLTAALLNQGSGIALAVVSALLVARVATGIRADELPPYLAALAVLTIAKAVFTWLDMWFAHNVAYGMLAWLRSSAYNALEPLAPAYTLKRRSGDVVSMATADIETIELFFAHTLVPLHGDDPGAHGAAHWAGDGRLAVSRRPPALPGAGGEPAAPRPAPGRSGRRRGPP